MATAGYSTPASPPVSTRVAPRGGSRGPAAPQRRCIASGVTGDRSSLLRFVVGPQGELVPDLAARLPGRGLWLTPRRDMVERAVTKRLFARSARRPVTVPAGLADNLEALLVQRFQDGLGLARRAGCAVGGFEKVREALRAGNAALLVEASDAAEDGRRKICGLARGLPIAIVVTAAELGAAFGRDHLVHAAVGRGPLAARLLADAEKLAGFRPAAKVDRGIAAPPGRSVVLERDERRD